MWLARYYAHRTHRPDIAPDACGHDPTLCPPIREENEMSTSLNCHIGDCGMCEWLRCTHECHGDDFDIAICGGCGAYGRLGEFHVRNGEECGEFV